MTPERERPTVSSSTGSTLDPIALLKGLGSLRRLAGMYPAGHPMIVQKVADIDTAVQRHLQQHAALRLDVIRGQVHVDGASYRQEGEAVDQIVRELGELGVDSIQFTRGVDPQELYALAQFLWGLKEQPREGSVREALLAQRITHIDLGRLVPLDTRWTAAQWPEGPEGPLDPAYAESLELTSQTFEDVTAGRGLDLSVVRDVVSLLILKVATSSVALGQILAVKLYENLTYCHSVNVATLSVLIARQLAFDERSIAATAEAALLHDIGKTRIPLDVLKKPGALDRRERKTMESHTTLGAEILVEVDGLQPLTPTVALEHHRAASGGGYPDLGERAIPHVLSQLVSVADIYEAVTGARSYQEPAQPEQACLLLARLAGTKLNTAIVKAFVNAVTFFPPGSLVRTSRGETGVVVRLNADDPLHPVLAPVNERLERVAADVDCSRRDGSGGYERHIIESLRPTMPVPLSELMTA